MSLVHPVVPRNATPPTPLPTAIDNINAALRALDGADTLVIDAAATALDTVLSRLPQVLAVHGVPSSLDGSGRYVLRLPTNGAADQVLIVANRTASPLRLLTADGASALVAALPAGRIEVFVLSGSTVGAYALSSARTGKANTSHTHPLSEITGFDIVGQHLLARRIGAQAIPASPGTATVILSEVLSNTLTGATLNTSTGVITIATTGLYRFIGMIDWGGNSGRCQFAVNDSILGAGYAVPPRSGVAFNVSPPIALSANNTVALVASHASASVQDIANNTSFCVERIR